MKGVGNDIIEIDRIRKSIAQHQEHFLNRIFTEEEQNYCLKFSDSAIHFAGRFSAKEAIAKALGVGFGAHLSWLDIEILNDPNGKPTVKFSDRIQKTWKNPNILVSISHSEH